jgi:hypothetical protein
MGILQKGFLGHDLGVVDTILEVQDESLWE